MNKIEIFSPPQESEVHAYCYLRPDLRINRTIQYGIYGNADGTGTATSKRIAIYKAISEALERWAYAEKSAGDLADAGLDINFSTDGFACFPGLFKSSARALSLYEAMERHVLCLFWEDRLGLPRFFSRHNYQCTLLTLDFPIKAVFALVYFYDDDLDFYFYGFGCSSSADDAEAKSLNEAIRTKRMLTHALTTQGLSSYQDLNQRNLYYTEKRLLYFGGKQGHAQFKAKTQNGARTMSVAERRENFKVCFSKEILGPWTQYATVWRTVFTPVSNLKNCHDNYEYFSF